MSVRRQRACYSSEHVVKWFMFNERKKGVIIYRRDNYNQKKALLYSKLKSIKSGNIKLPIPLKHISETVHIITVELDGMLTYGHKKYINHLN